MHRSSRKDQKENKPATPPEEKPIVKAEPVRSRLDQLKDIFKRKNSPTTIEDFRQRYFARKANGLIVGPV